MVGKYFRYFALFIQIISVVLIIGGCHQPEKTTRESDSRVILLPASKELSGLRIEDIAVRAEETVSDKPLYMQTIRHTAEKTKPAVVSILSEIQLSTILGMPGSNGTSLGSGFFIHPSGYILTNFHVIKNANAIRIHTHDDEEFEVSVIAFDQVFDLALLKVRESSKDFKYIAMGDFQEVGVGDMTIAIGHPLGLGFSVTFGIISQKERQIGQIVNKRLYDARFIQMDTSIHPGSSGGPLITLSGAWVGVNVAGIPSAAGISFAVSSNDVEDFLDNIREGEGQWSKFKSETIK